jgi:hypothetical protein
LRVANTECPTEAHNRECHYSERRNAECRYAGRRYAGRRYAECRYAECRGSRITSAHSETDVTRLFCIVQFCAISESV